MHQESDSTFDFGDGYHSLMSASVNSVIQLMKWYMLTQVGTHTTLQKLLSSSSPSSSSLSSSSSSCGTQINVLAMVCRVESSQSLYRGFCGQVVAETATVGTFCDCAGSSAGLCSISQYLSTCQTALTTLRRGKQEEQRM